MVSDVEAVYGMNNPGSKAVGGSDQQSGSDRGDRQSKNDTFQVLLGTFPDTHGPRLEGSDPQMEGLGSQVPAF